LFKTFFGVKIHVGRVHLVMRCLACGVMVPNLKRHIYEQALKRNEAHMVLLALIPHTTKCWRYEKNRKLLEECTEKAMEVCKVNGGGGGLSGARSRGSRP